MNSQAIRFRAVSWNIHGCVGRDGRFDPGRVADAVSALAPDIVALQEVDARPAVAGAMDTFEYLNSRIPGNAAAAHTMGDENGGYGQMLISRRPIRDIQTLDLSFPGREPRAAILATLEEPRLTVVAAHLGLTLRERRYQLALIKRTVLDSDTPVGLILGDFNEWQRQGLATRVFCPPFRAAAAFRSFPARWPVFPLDRIWCRAPLEPVAARIVAEARDLSDHLPVLADFELQRDERAARFSKHRGGD
jgi:endonuclease/exonuclease/phosphatase family metal-dependent hydrolase